MAVRQVRASVLERVRTAWVGQVALGFLRLRSGQALRLRAPSAVSCDESVRRFAQDDDFVGVLKKRSRRLALMGLRPGLSSAVSSGLSFATSWFLTPAVQLRNTAL